jgi:hypothetical protein
MAKIELKCCYCNKIFEKELRFYKSDLKKSGKSKEDFKVYCSKKCFKLAHSKKIIELQCNFCGKSFLRDQKQINGNLKNGIKNNFCSHSCNAFFNNKKRIENGFSLKGKIKNIKCNKCNSLVEVKINRSKKNFLCENCKVPRIPKEYKKNCFLCNKEIIARYNVKYCKECLPIARHNAAVASVKSQIEKRASKNENFFAQMCKDFFGENNVITNEAIFKDVNGNYWDADVIIPSIKIAISWNGEFWHSSKRCAARDKIKDSIIKDNGYYHYIINDSGRFNIEYVQNQFHKFLNPEL